MSEKEIKTNKIADKRKPYRFDLVKFSECLEETVTSAYSRYSWVRTVIKTNPIIWFCPGDDTEVAVTVKRDFNFVEEVACFIYSKRWCVPIEDAEEIKKAEEFLIKGEEFTKEKDWAALKKKRNPKEKEETFRKSKVILDGREIEIRELEKALEELVQVDDEEETHVEEIVLTEIKNGVLVFEKTCFHTYK